MYSKPTGTPTLRIPAEANFGFCPVGETASYELTIENTTREETEFVWLMKDPFKITPAHGKVPGKKSQVVTITFLPDSATRFDGEMICRFGKNLLECSKLNVVGVAKIPHISLSTEQIDFGHVPSGCRAKRELTVHNSAPVPATVNIVSDFHQFKITPTQIHLDPEGTKTVTIEFHPTNFDFFAFANISFTTAGGNSALMRCSAYVNGPVVTVDHTYIHFDKVQLKSEKTSKIKIQNHSDRPIYFEFMIEPTSCFQFSVSQGILAAKSTHTIRLTFKPQFPIAYYRRVILLIHQHHPIAIDLYGSAFDTFTQPPDLLLANIQANRRIIAEGKGGKPPHLLENEPVKDTVMPQVDFISGDLKRNQCTMQYGAHLFDELFTHTDLVTMSASNFEFGQCTRDVSPDKQTLTVKNNTDDVICLFWEKNSSDLASIEPSTAEIPKHQSIDLKVKFNPLLEFQYMGATIEGYAQFKDMRKETIAKNFPTLPFILTPFVNGHTMDDVTSFIPTMDTSHKRLSFAGSIAGDANYQTFFVHNKGDCAFKYDVRIIEPQNQDKGALSSSAAAFSVFPQVGTINKGSFQIFVVRFSPPQRGHYHAQLFATINDSPANTFSVALRGDASVPAVSFSTTGTLFLHPVSLGSISTQSIRITNDSSVPMKLEWKIPSIYQNLLLVKPQTAEIRSHEVIDCMWEFHPDAVGEFRVEVVCNVQALAGSSHAFISKEMLPFIIGKDQMNNDTTLFSSLKTVQHYPLTICTLVTDCIVNSKPSAIDFGFVRINSAAMSTLSISNHSDSQMHFLLQSSSPDKLLQFTPADDVLPPRSSREVEVRFTPKTPGIASDSILCSLLNESIYQHDCVGNKKSFDKFIVKSSVSEICKVTGIGCFPHLSIIDIFSPKYSRALIWENSSCNAINGEMNLLGCDSLTDELKQFIVDFGFDTVDAEPTSIYIKFKNVGHIAFNFSINFPNDVSIDPEYWALPDEIDPNQLKQDQIMQAKLFRVSEKKFHLEPNESCNVCFSYSHKFIESHQLPVVLSVQNGRIIRLLLKGTTLDPSLPYIVNYKPVFDLQSVPIGSMEPAVQLMPIFNASLVDADYRIDLTQVQEVNETNHNFEIFKCLNPLGNIRPRSSSVIQWVFKPLEAIQYEVSILCVVSNGNSFTVTLRGRGIHTDHEECDVEWSTAPPKSLIIENVSPIVISEQYMMFGDIPVFASRDRILYITNTTERALEYTADLQTDVLKLEPSGGLLEPNECKKLLLTVTAPGNPMIFSSAIPLIFSEPHDSIEHQPTEEELAEEEQILVADPPIDTTGLRSSRVGALKRLRDHPEEWKSVGERTLEMSQKTKQMNSRLFSTHIGKRGAEVQHIEAPQVTAIQYIDVAFNAMTKNEYRDRYGSIDTFYFEAENPQKAESNGQHQDEVADLLGEIVDEALADQQVRKLAMNDAKQRKQHIPLFSQLYKSDPVINVPIQEPESLADADAVEKVLHDIIDEIINEAKEGHFQLDKDIIQVSGFKSLQG